MVLVDSIPGWDNSGIIPPIRPGHSGGSFERSPYLADIATFVDRFMLSNERKGILKGLLDYRKALYSVGITKGFQWFDGSFLENIEILEERAPRDLDVVTFYHPPKGVDEKDQFAGNEVMDRDILKSKYHVDAYYLTLGEETEARQIKMISYWYSMWSHRRNGHWKGFVQVALDPMRDAEALKVLSGGENND